MRVPSDQLLRLQEYFDYLVDLGDGDPPSIDPVKWQSPENDRLIHIAAMQGNLDAVSILVDAGEDVNVIGDMGQTPAHFAAMGQRRAVFDFLMEKGADATIVDEFGHTPSQAWTFYAKLERSR